MLNSGKKTLSMPWSKINSFWEKLFTLQLSIPLRIFGATSIATLGFYVLYFVHHRTGTYFTFVAVMTSLFVSFFAGDLIALGAAVLLSLLCDYFFIPPVGSIFHNEKSVEQFALILFGSVIMSILASSLRSAFIRLSEAKKLADQATGEAREASARMEKVLALVSHDVRNPLCTSKMAAQLLLESTGNVDRRSTVVMILRNLERADQLIQSLLDVSRIRTSGRILMNFHRCDLRAQIARLIEEQTLANGHRLIYVAGKTVWGEWGTDGIKRAVENLITNALKYGDGDFPVIVSLHHEGDKAVLSVHNQGNEIAPADQNRLFDFFQRGSTAHDDRGWGIGLAVVKAVAEAHGGFVTVESGRGLGTKFIMTIQSRGDVQQEQPRFFINPG
jgi:signal transduction histidine kinase